MRPPWRSRAVAVGGERDSTSASLRVQNLSVDHGDIRALVDVSLAGGRMPSAHRSH